MRILLTVFLSVILTAWLLRERWTTPADELAIVLRYHSALVKLEKEHQTKYGRYAHLTELLSKAGRESITNSCMNGYCFDVNTENGGFEIRIVPDPSRQQEPSPRRLSLYADHTRAIRIKYGGSPADSSTPVFPAEKLRRFGGS
jgi:hypothetical protein